MYKIKGYIWVNEIKYNIKDIDPKGEIHGWEYLPNLMNGFDNYLVTIDELKED